MTVNGVVTNVWNSSFGEIIMFTQFVPVLLTAGILALSGAPSPAIAETFDCGDGIPIGQVERPNVNGLLPIEVVGEEPGSPVNVRAEPGLESEIVAQVVVGDRLFVSARQYTLDSGAAFPGAVCEL